MEEKKFAWERLTEFAASVATSLSTTLESKYENHTSRRLMQR